MEDTPGFAVLVLRLTSAKPVSCDSVIKIIFMIIKRNQYKEC